MGHVTAVVGSCIAEFQALQESGKCEIRSLHYDHLMQKPVEVTTQMFELMGLPPHYVQMALTAMQHDTQKGTVLSNISNSSSNIRRMTGEDMRSMNVALTLLGLPDMNQEFVMY